MGLSGPCETSGAPRFYEVYGSSARLAFSRYFIVAHVDGFLYVLDKYFCISRLVPARAKRPGTPHAGGLGQQSERSGGLLWDSGLDADRATGEVDGRQAAADQGGGADGGHSFSADGGEADGGSLLVPVRIADVFSALFRNDRPVFSQLLTGSNQVSRASFSRNSGRSKGTSFAWHTAHERRVATNAECGWCLWIWFFLLSLKGLEVTQIRLACSCFCAFVAASVRPAAAARAETKELALEQPVGWVFIPLPRKVPGSRILERYCHRGG